MRKEDLNSKLFIADAKVAKNCQSIVKYVKVLGEAGPVERALFVKLLAEYRKVACTGEHEDDLLAI